MQLALHLSCASHHKTRSSVALVKWIALADADSARSRCPAWNHKRLQTLAQLQARGQKRIRVVRRSIDEPIEVTFFIEPLDWPLFI